MTTPETKQEAEDTTATEFQTLFREVESQKSRLMKLSQSLRAEKPELAAVYGEIAGTILAIVADVISTTGGAIDAMEEAVTNLEEENAPPVSQLLPEDAEEYITYAETVKGLCSELKKSLPADATEQHGIFDKLIMASDDRIEFTKDITLEVEEDDEEPEPAEETH